MGIVLFSGFCGRYFYGELKKALNKKENLLLKIFKKWYDIHIKLSYVVLFLSLVHIGLAIYFGGII
ncbi:hypothetical protein ciss_11150 [Carboxydothermus islandicus]|uniref:Uncharacterized protein n=2 Tax=Carboxydothermus islandicus TaxID=661089 RepID=A0A1L8D1Y1_9THEO|nr:hypothetical protein ciss_11150 [Carboxydothermus islandicus]